MKVIDNVATGTTQSLAFVSYSDGHSGVDDVTRNVYSAEDLEFAVMFRDFRINCGLTLGECARALDLSVTDVGGIELGSKSFATFHDVALACATMLKSRKEKISGLVS